MYKVKIIRLNGSIFETEVNGLCFNPSQISAYYLGPHTIIKTQLIETKFSRFSGDIEEITYKEI